MSFSYGPDAANPADQIRFLLGETSEPSDVQDEEIQMVMTQVGAVVTGTAQPPLGVVYRACWTIATAIAGRFTNAVNWSATTRGSLSFQNADKYKHWMDLAGKYKTLMSMAPVVPLAGGISIVQKQLAEQDADRVPPFFTRESATEPGTDRTDQSAPAQDNMATFPI